MRHTRRHFIQTSAATAAAGTLGMAGLNGLFKRAVAATDQPRMETLTEWLQADVATRKRAINDCLERIKKLDPQIHAWVVVQPEQPTGSGPLDQIPFGVKDIVETKGMLTEYGSPLYKGRVGTEDAAIIRDMRNRGAVLLGKTVTTAFAYRTPGPTRNPRDLAHTPGGSSSGSAAAIAAGMVPLTIGEQTRGSMIRPASFCGVTGFKPTHDLIPMEGVLILAKSLDTLGFFTHTPMDTLALWKALGKPTGADEEFVFAAPDPIPACDPDMAHAFKQSLALLRSSDVQIKSIDIAGLLEKLDQANITEMFYEGARANEARLKEFGSRLDAPLAKLVRDGLQIPDEKYKQARQFLAESRERLAEIFKTTPVILTPAAPGAAPLGLSTTGDPRMNAPWTALGTPAITIPMPTASGLPLGIQMTADIGQDARLIRAAIDVYKRFGAAPKIAPA